MEITLVNKKDKPQVCLCDLDVFITPKKWLHLVKHENESVRKDAIKKHVTKKSFTNMYMTLLNGKFPTAITEERLLRNIWRAINSKDKFEDLSLEIRDIKIKSTSPINYEFDYEKH